LDNTDPSPPSPQSKRATQTATPPQVQSSSQTHSGPSLTPAKVQWEWLLHNASYADDGRGDAASISVSVA